MKYEEALGKAYLIYDSLFGKPKTHQQWADAFNVRGELVKILMEKVKKK